jgi:NAD(P)H-hydrate epimerase
MKILDVTKIREADSYTIENEPITSIDLMERAGKNCTKWITKKLNKKQEVYIFAGPGNNGGDGLVIGRHLAKKGYRVHIVLVLFTENFSNDFRKNLERIQQIDEVKILKVKSKKNLPQIPAESLIIDSIFGSGLSRPVKGLAAEAIYHMKESQAIIVSIDIPSGLFADEYSDPKKGAIVRADYTLSLQLPKFSFMFSENEFIIGELVIIPIGLHPDYLNKVNEKALLINLIEAKPLLKTRSKFSHKGSYGHALLIAGSYGKIGAAVLAAKASLRSGLGLLTTHTPKEGVNIMQTAIPESMLSIDEHDEFFSNLPDLSKYNAIGIGPGLGTDKQTQNSLKLLIQEFNGPMVLDADALNILSENKTWLSFLTAGSILTPHPKEFERLAGKSNNSFERIKKQMDFAIKYQVYVVLKGAHSSIATPQGKLFFNASGNPGMATAGSGDVLTGIVLGLLAQNYSALEATILGVFIHGLAGDKAATKKSMQAMIAGDIIDYLGKAFHELGGN